ncbi:hypothetical protein L6452_34537 [Arctium lappa]|uniref:Uncharacterized protein n=1 Tax=Arctium lappa TaxID=4217 RepID=A0ACB8YIL6_ARCLA|nr:hypothetical protein L6452_34537 [Arctium lappa]
MLGNPRSGCGCSCDLEGGAQASYCSRSVPPRQKRRSGVVAVAVAAFRMLWFRVGFSYVPLNRGLGGQIQVVVPKGLSRGISWKGRFEGLLNGLTGCCALVFFWCQFGTKDMQFVPHCRLKSARSKRWNIERLSSGLSGCCSWCWSCFFGCQYWALDLLRINGDIISGELDFGKVAIAQGLAKLVVAYTCPSLSGTTTAHCCGSKPFQLGFYCNSLLVAIPRDPKTTRHPDLIHDEPTSCHADWTIVKKQKIGPPPRNSHSRPYEWD